MELNLLLNYNYMFEMTLVNHNDYIVFGNCKREAIKLMRSVTGETMAITRIECVYLKL